MRMTRSGGSLRKIVRIARKAPKVLRIVEVSSATPSPAISSVLMSARTPAARIRTPAAPKISHLGSRARICAARSAPWRSPEASPATIKTRRRRGPVCGREDSSVFSALSGCIEVWIVMEDGGLCHTWRERTLPGGKRGVDSHQCAWRRDRGMSIEKAGWEGVTNVGDDCSGRNLECVVDAELMPVGAEQEAHRHVHDHAAFVALALEMENLQHRVDLLGLAGKENPSRVIGLVCPSVFEKIPGMVVLGV